MPVTGTKSRAQGVIASVLVADGEVTLLLQDGAADSTDPARWKVVRLYTERKYSITAFTDLKSADYEEIGFNLVNRLSAMAGIVPPEPTPRPKRRRH